MQAVKCGFVLNLYLHTSKADMMPFSRAFIQSKVHTQRNVHDGVYCTRVHLLDQFIRYLRCGCVVNLQQCIAAHALNDKGHRMHQNSSS